MDFLKLNVGMIIVVLRVVWWQLSMVKMQISIEIE